MIVIDSSALLEYCSAARGHRRSKSAFLHPTKRCMRHLLDLEVAQVLRRYCISGEMSQPGGKRRSSTCSIFRSHATRMTFFWTGSGSCGTT